MAKEVTELLVRPFMREGVLVLATQSELASVQDAFWDALYSWGDGFRLTQDEIESEMIHLVSGWTIVTYRFERTDALEGARQKVRRAYSRGDIALPWASWRWREVDSSKSVRR